ncbi:MAG: 28S ribosomal protein S7, mitochondrial [Paramarteilia canceri]
MIVYRRINRVIGSGQVRKFALYPKEFYREPLENRDGIANEEAKNSQFLPASSQFTPGCILYDENVNKFINILMREGKKEKSQKIVYRAMMELKLLSLEKIHTKESHLLNENIITNPHQILTIALENVTPVIDLVKVGKRGIIYDVPTTIHPNVARLKAIRWIIEGSRPKTSDNKTYDQRLAIEIYNAHLNKGNAVKLKDDLMKKIQENRAYVTYKWS